MAASDFTSLCGKFLIAMPGMGDERFDKSVVFVCAHSEEGAMGFIVNQALESPTVSDFFRQLEIIDEAELIQVPEHILGDTLHVGGPVEPGRGFVLHSGEYDSKSTLEIGADVCLTATLEILRAIATGNGPDKCLIALGYAGWSAGQLEDEISSNGWLLAEADSKIIFGCKNHQKYERVLSALGIDPVLLSSQSGHA